MIGVLITFWPSNFETNSIHWLSKWYKMMPSANCTHSVLRHCRGLDQWSTNRQATKRPQWSQPVGVWARKSKARHAAQCGPPVPLYAVGIIFWGGCQHCKEIGQCKKIWWRGSPSHHLILAKHIQCGKAAKVPDCCSDIFICNLCIVFMSKKMTPGQGS